MHLNYKKMNWFNIGVIYNNQNLCSLKLDNDENNINNIKDNLNNLLKLDFKNKSTFFFNNEKIKELLYKIFQQILTNKYYCDNMSNNNKLIAGSYTYSIIDESKIDLMNEDYKKKINTTNEQEFIANCNKKTNQSKFVFDDTKKYDTTFYLGIMYNGYYNLKILKLENIDKYNINFNIDLNNPNNTNLIICYLLSLLGYNVEYKEYKLFNYKEHNINYCNNLFKISDLIQTTNDIDKNEISEYITKLTNIFNNLKLYYFIYNNDSLKNIDYTDFKYFKEIIIRITDTIKTKFTNNNNKIIETILIEYTLIIDELNRIYKNTNYICVEQLTVILMLIKKDYNKSFITTEISNDNIKQIFNEISEYFFINKDDYVQLYNFITKQIDIQNIENISIDSTNNSLNNTINFSDSINSFSNSFLKELLEQDQQNLKATVQDTGQDTVQDTGQDTVQKIGGKTKQTKQKSKNKSLRKFKK